jgi:aspartate/methionine/tyrosine aminotransferase
MFSSRVPADLQANRLARALARARAAGRHLIDLTVTNPTAAGIEYPASVLEALSHPDGDVYDPHPLGLRTAREAVAGDYARRGVTIAPDRIVLTSSTSEAYSLLFKLLCEPSGDGVLVPSPSYPLFDHLTRLDGVTTAAYTLEYHGRWMVDSERVDAAWTPRTRAVLAVSPNNPTGSILSDAEIEALSMRCAERDAALILDEVFADYPLTQPATRTANDEPRTANRELRTAVRAVQCLTFRLGGLSKSAGLPQVKLGWMAVDGPEALVGEALDRLELLCDTYLSVSTPVQVAAPLLIATGARTRERILLRVLTNDGRLRERAAAHPAVEALSVEAGWSAVLRIPSRASEEDVVLDLLDRDGVVVHPGFFFDFPHEAFLVVSLLPPPAEFDEGIRRVLHRVGG